MQFDSFEKLDIKISETDTAKRLSNLHKGFESRYSGTYEYYTSVSETAKRCLAISLNWEESAITPELLPKLFDSAKKMIEGEIVDGEKTRGLKDLHGMKKNNKFKHQIERQRAGFAAELISTWKENAQALKDGTGTTTYRVDDLSEEFKKRANELGESFRKNDPYVDKIRVNAKGEIIERIQSKFVGGDAKGCLQKLLSKEYDKYFLDGKVDTVEVPKDFYGDINMLIGERKIKLEKQIEYLKTAVGKEEILEKRLSQLERLKSVENMIKPSTVTYNEAKFAVNHPKIYAVKLFTDKVIESGHGAGIETGLEASALATAVSTVDNVQKYIAGEITVEEAVKDIIKDAGLAGIGGYGTGFVEKVIADSMSASSHTMLSKMSKAGVPAAIVTFGVESFDITVDFAKGEITASEYAYDLGKNAANVVGGVAGGTMLAGLPGGQMIGSMVGCAVAAEAYVTAVEYGGKGVDLLAEKAQEMADKAVDAAKTEIPDKVDFVRTAINDFAAENNVPIRV